VYQRTDTYPPAMRQAIKDGVTKFGYGNWLPIYKSYPGFAAFPKTYVRVRCVNWCGVLPCTSSNFNLIAAFLVSVECSLSLSQTHIFFHFSFCNLSVSLNLTACLSLDGGTR
jgi:hypothetical protein